MRDVVQWTTPAPLWPQATAGQATQARRAELLRPTLLRFASDSFMEDFIGLLEQNPAALGGFVAQPETWRDLVASPALPAAVSKLALPLSRARLAGERKKQGAAASAPLVNTNGANNPAAKDGAGETVRPLKLYQPAHQRYYLLASCLVCARAGLPDRALDPARDERATFVVRRLFPATITDAQTGKSKPFVDARTGEVDRSSRRLPEFDETWEEYAFVTTPTGEAGWQKVVGAHNQSADSLVAGEDQLPLFPLNYTEDTGRRRRVFAGLAPAGKREAYMGAAYLPQATSAAASVTAAAAGGDAAEAKSAKPFDTRLMTLWLDVTEPWKRLIERADAVRRMQRPDVWPQMSPPPANYVPTPSDEDKEPMSADGLSVSLRAAREQIQTGSWYILLDFAAYLQTNFRDTVWQAVLNGSPSVLAAGTPQRALYDALVSTTLAGWRRDELLNELTYPAPVKSPYKKEDVRTTLAAALKSIAAAPAGPADPTNEALLEAAATSYDRFPADGKPDPNWPRFLFPFAHPEYDKEKGPTNNPPDVELGPLPAVTIAGADKLSKLDQAIKKIDAFAALVEAALPSAPPAPGVRAPVPLAAQRVMDTREGYFRLRCVYERPLCGPIDKPVVSAPTREFQFAAFFDPDAPARPIRIGLPIDTSPAGLRKFDKNTAFMMSDMLCGQVQRMKGLTLGDLVRSVLPWPLHKDLSVPDGGSCKEDGGLQVGMICSLSIPIVTICALLLLMIIVSLLDFIFRWIPYFLICFPLPGFGAKK